MRIVFFGFAVVLLLLATAVGMGTPGYYYTGSGGVPNAVSGPLAGGLAIAGGLSLVAAALDRSSGKGSEEK